MRTHCIAVLRDSGLAQVSLRRDGRRVVLEGHVQSFDCKVRAVDLLRPLVHLPILNCIRVHPV